MGALIQTDGRHAGRLAHLRGNYIIVACLRHIANGSSHKNMKKEKNPCFARQYDLVIVKRITFFFAKFHIDIKPGTIVRKVITQRFRDINNALN